MSQTAKTGTRGLEPNQTNRQASKHTLMPTNKYPMKVRGLDNSQFRLKVNYLIRI